MLITCAKSRAAAPHLAGPSNPLRKHSGATVAAYGRPICNTICLLPVTPFQVHCDPPYTANMSFRGVMKDGWHPKGKDGASKESWRGDFKGINQVVRRHLDWAEHVGN